MCSSDLMPAPALLSATPAGLYETGSDGLVVGGIALLHGENLAYWDLAASALPLPGELNKTIVEVNGVPAPLFAVSPGEVSLQIPWELSGMSTVSLRVVVDGKASNRIEVALATAAPQLLAAVPAGDNTAAIAPASADSAGTQPGAMQRGSVMVLYGLGLGAVSNPPSSGNGASMESPSLSLELPEVYIGDVPAQVLYSGLAPQWVGVYQINVAVPMDAPAESAVAVQLRVAGTSSNQLMVPVN